MKRNRVMLVSLLALAVALAPWAAVKTSAFHVDGMKNDVAAKRVTDAVKALPGVQDAVADPANGILMVRYESTKVSSVDLAQAADGAGYSLGAVETGAAVSPAGKETADHKAKAVLTDFAQVYIQASEFVDKDRYGIVRNLAPAMKLRRDAVVNFEKGDLSSKAKGSATGPYQLAQGLSKAVDDFAASAELKDKAQMKAKLPAVKQAFKALADARNFEELVAPSVAVKEKAGETSLQDLMKDYVNKLFGGK
jgi:copper chaperone CopZ